LLTGSNNYNLGVVIPEAGSLKEVLCLARRDSMLQELFTTLSSGGLKNPGQGSVKYPGDPAEETEVRLYAGLSITNPAPLLVRE